MRYRQRYKHLLNVTAAALLWLIQVAAFAWIWYQIYVPSMSIENRFWYRGNWAVIGMYGLFLFFFTKVLGGYRIGYSRIVETVISNYIAIIVSNLVEYFQLCLITNSYVSPLPLAMLMVFELIFALPYIYMVRKIYLSMYPPRKMILVYGDRSPENMLSKMNNRSDRYDVCAAVSYNVGNQKLYKMFKDYEAVVLYDIPAEARNDIMKHCYQESIRTYVTPKISDVIMRGAEDIHMFDTPLLLSRNQGLTINQRFWKRTIDIVLSLIGLAIVAPFMIITAVIIKCTDGGPVFYTQKRLTRDGKEFDILKFRSMRSDSEAAGARLAMKDDDRVTPIGKFIRRIHFDEIPQILNILKGDMSIVGPRPERKEIQEQYEEVIPEFPLRLKVKAGLTGYAQVYGKYNTTPYDKVKMDIAYIEEYSFWLDIKLIMMTAKVLFQKENSEGVDSNQTTAIKVDEEK